ncbi:MAG: IS481 family transposase [Bacteroidota bacterium]
MPWTHTHPMDERAKFIHHLQDGLYSMTELCHRFGVSRKTGYKWRDRYDQGGLDALADRSRAPRTCPHTTPAHVAALLLDARRAHPTWGPLKLLHYLRPRHPEFAFPAPSTVGDLLARHGLVQPRRTRRPHRTGPVAAPLTTTAPGEVWSADFKGEFRLGSRAYCYPLTVQDAHARFLLACEGLPSTATEGARTVFERLFAEHGLPVAIRTDNGVPFAARGLCGLSRLSVWWLKLGIRPDRIAPAQPQQNGRHERMHKTLKAEATRPPSATMAGQQARFDAFRAEYNTERPHQALGGAVPAAHYARSPRALPSRCPEPEYAGHLEVRRVSGVGTVKFKGREVFLTTVLSRERVGLEEVADGVWAVRFAGVELGRLDERRWVVSSGHPGRSAAPPRAR